MPSAEEELARRDELLSTLAHELRSPLNAVLGWAHVLRTGKLDAAAAARGLEIICRNAELQGQIITDGLDLARAMAGAVRLDTQTVELAPLLRSALDATRPEAEEKELKLEAAFDHAGSLAGDPERLRQILRNLVAAVVKFSARKSVVRLAVRRSEREIELEVATDGCDVPPQALSQVFERLREAEAPAGGRNYGGLGLVLARYLAELHGGAVRAAGSGASASFTLRLPLRPDRS
jgi:signal transduction histidine kinase